MGGVARVKIGYECVNPIQQISNFSVKAQIISLSFLCVCLSQPRALQLFCSFSRIHHRLYVNKCVCVRVVINFHSCTLTFDLHVFL